MLWMMLMARCKTLQSDGNKSVLAKIKATFADLNLISLSPLSQKAPASLVAPMFTKILNLDLKNSVDAAIPALALQTVVSNLPRPLPGQAIATHISTTFNAIVTMLLPRLIGVAPVKYASRNSSTQLPVINSNASNHARTVIPDTINVLIEVVRHFGIMMGDDVVSAVQQSMSRLLENDAVSTGAKRRAVVAISALAIHTTAEGLNSMLQNIVQTLSRSGTDATATRNYISILGSFARSIPARMGAHVPQMAPLILDLLGQSDLQRLREQLDDGIANLTEFNEVRESALVALDALLYACPMEMKPFTEAALDSILRYINFDPNSVVDDGAGSEAEDDEQFDDNLSDEEEDDGFDDDDDASWKVRRCAAKAISTVSQTRAPDLLQTLYDQSGPALVRRLCERQEDVRLEIIAALDLLVCKTRDIVSESSDMSPVEYGEVKASTRKRRRQSSGELAANNPSDLVSSNLEASPLSGSRADLAKLIPPIVKASVKILRGKSLPAKQAIVKLLDDIVCTQGVHIGDALSDIIQPIVQLAQSTSSPTMSVSAAAGGNSSATTTTLRMSTLKLISDIAKTHSIITLESHLPQMILSVISATTDRFYKVSGEAVRTAQELAKAITPPRCRAVSAKFQPELSNIYDAILERIVSSETDLEVRQDAIHTLATILASTSALDGFWLSVDRKTAGLSVILNRLKNETTRLAAVRAVVIVLTSVGNLPIETQWAHHVAEELTKQLRKAHRGLKMSSITALRLLLATPSNRGIFDDTSLRTIVMSLLPGIGQADSLILGPSLLILADIALEKSDMVLEADVILSVCHLLVSPLVGIVLEQILTFFGNIGSTARSRALMTALLRDVSISGDPNIIGKVIGTLVVASGSSTGVSCDSFVQELNNSSQVKDIKRVCLAVTVLGEIGMRVGVDSTIEPGLFLHHFHREPDRTSLAAATALGRAGSTNIDKFLPPILQTMSQGGNLQYLAIIAIREMLKQTTDLASHALPVWEQILQASANLDSRVVCAECVGRMAIISPDLFLPRLQVRRQSFLPY